MDSITEKIAKVTDLSAYTDLTPERLKELFNEINSSPEKLRTVLNLWFVPEFRPTFIEPRNYAFSGLQDIDFLESPDTEGAQRPLRLIDLETGNLVDSWTTSPMDSYCMLSHRWKGDEITLDHIKRARENHLDRSRSGKNWVDECQSLVGDDVQVLLERCCKISGIALESLASNDDDIHLVLKQCVYDILEQEQVIASLLGEKTDSIDIGGLLKHRTTINDVRGEVNWARQNLDAKKSKLERCRMEKEMFDQLIKQINKDTHERMEDVGESGDATQVTSGADRQGAAVDADNNKEGPGMIEKAKEEYQAAQKSLNMANEKANEAQDYAEPWFRNNRLGDALDEIMGRLQRWKSAIKLVRSMEEAKKIFGTKMFPKQGACYIWSDTCCIDKLNYGELSQSLSLMGDWYANAEFCLVHLDTTWRAGDAIYDWAQLKGVLKDDSGVPAANIPSFSDIHASKPEWSNRAWTLQELVMSKMAFFVNSQWKSLSRPVESLGYMYALVPFIELYTRGVVSDMYSKFLESVESAVPKKRVSDVVKLPLDTEHIEVVECKDGDRVSSQQIREAVRIISILHALGFKFPTNITTETAISELTQSVYLAASSLVRDENADATESGRRILETLKSAYMHVDSTAQPEKREREAQEIINFLLACLISETKDLVVSDREYIAKFGEVNQLDTWKRGSERSGFPAQQVLELSCRRKATVPVDHVYSLMGILGVRFQSFHAEGYPKALSRLLDEVIIARNDVSVFNWTGVEMGSPIRGRSLYPATHKAYGTDDDRGRRYNILIAAKTEQKRNEIMATYHGIIKMLQNAIDCIKAKGRKDIPLGWIKDICAFIRNSTFDELRHDLKSIGKILVYIKDHCVQNDTQAAETPPAETNMPSVSDEKSTRSFNLKPSLAGMNIPSITKPKMPSFGMGLSKPSFGKQNSEPPAQTDSKKAASNNQDKPAEPKVPEWMSLDRDVRKYLKSIELHKEDQNPQRPELPSQIRDLHFEGHVSQDAITQTGDGESSTAMKDLICPNPIIVNNSGIDGIFDIQRIVVTMIDREKLHRQVARATSPKQKISGWCTLSTGFASVAVNFACEKHILEKQLEVAEAVEDIVIKEDRVNKVHRDLGIQRAMEAKEGSGSTEAADGDEMKKGKEKAQTREERAIVRIIQFIQEPQLQLVAGEWVLARFSGVPGAKWFLCHLELGSTHQFYGHRIATTEINFANSSVESGLVNAWQTYMGRKKRKMCQILDTYVKGLESAAQRQERLTTIVDVGTQSFERVKSMETPSLTMLKLPFSESEKEIKSAVEDDSEDEEKAKGDFLDEMLDQGKKAAMAVGEYTVFAAYEKISQLHATHLDKHLATSVLKKTPKSLQTAVESVDENKGFLPAMFHSSRRVHMF